ncbi:hypothetical protein [Winslowiella toletana]|uniref:hypothetical protein n=1 Tax=Winslowiella toletana TaxID=92490 RepID=UPI0028BE0D2A|nr:hypothetical protein [Winslowiella toletana]WNN42828.1 hypothetical protein RIN69_14010 [Winslowiella toletana]
MAGADLRRAVVAGFVTHRACCTLRLYEGGGRLNITAHQPAHSSNPKPISFGYFAPCQRCQLLKSIQLSAVGCVVLMEE